jgi:hypothetical protein
MRKLIFAIGLLLLNAPATQANIPDYCAAYARDIADRGKSSNDWQRRHDNAKASCITRFSAFEASPAKPTAKPKPKPVAVTKKPEKPKAEIKTKAKIETPPETKVVAKAALKLKEGSKEWIAYCKQKYVSFNESKGTYLSKSGIERKCLVTAE